MTDPTTDGPDPVDHALDQLRQPHILLAEALLLTRAAQALSREIEAEDDDPIESPRAGRHRRLLDEAFQLVQIAKTASDLAVAERAVYPLTSDDLDEKAMQPSPPDDCRPHAVNGVRFVAAADGIPMGVIGDSSWLWSEMHGFVNVTAADSFDGLKTGGVRAVFSGILKTATDTQVIGVTGDGRAVLLPRACVIESPDE